MGGLNLFLNAGACVAAAFLGAVLGLWLGGGALELREHAVRLKFYLGESDRYRGQPAYPAVVHLMRERGLWGATETRGTYGFGKRSRRHSDSALRRGDDLPWIVEAGDSKEKDLALIPELSTRVRGGLTTVGPVKGLRHLG